MFRRGVRTAVRCSLTLCLGLEVAAIMVPHIIRKPVAAKLERELLLEKKKRTQMTAAHHVHHFLHQPDFVALRHVECGGCVSVRECVRVKVAEATLTI